MMRVTAIFDIGRNYKKFFLFDKKFNEVYKEYVQFEDILDEDGYPCDNLPAITVWIRKVFNRLLESDQFEIDSINFSAYGAALVHLDKYGKPITPLYSYTKPYPESLLRSFYARYGSPEQVAQETASPQSGMLNSGLQLYWLKQTKPDIFNRIKHSIHLPQYLSYLFTKLPVSEFTTLGCHSSLWDFSKNDYHHWVYTEEIDRVLPPIIPVGTTINVNYEGRKINVGIGMLASAASLLPYIRAERKPFMLVSTGTWCVSQNPFGKSMLTKKDLAEDCLHYLRIDGKPVRANRLFLGNEYKLQVTDMCKHFGVVYGYHRNVKFDQNIYQKCLDDKQSRFRFKSIENTDQPEATDFNVFDDFETAFHKLMMELMALQFESSKRAMGRTRIKKVYIDGAFADNELYVSLATLYFKDYSLLTTQFPLGSALGAAMALSDQKVKSKFLRKHYAMRRHQPIVLQ